jgi:adenosylcobinamide-phosphate synthase
MTMISAMMLPAAFVLDALIGDPHWLPHPVRGMGRAIEYCEPVFRRWFRNEFWAGTCFALFLILSCWGISALLVYATYALNSSLGIVLEVVLIFFCLSARCLSQAAMEIDGLLKKGRVDEARSRVALIVGRDVQTYGRDDIARATVETVAENFVDGVLAPLFFAALGGAPLALAYKMVNTLDSMVGYKNERYLRFGRAAARIDDAANFLPARLAVPLIALAAQLLSGRHGRRSLATGFAQGRCHCSPNAGFPEAAFAGALAVKLNGPNTYGGVLVEKPFIGAAFGPVSPHHIRMACRLMTVSSLWGCLAAWCLHMLVH